MQKNIPKLRFSEFKDEWGEKRLSDVADFLKGSGISKQDILSNGIEKCIRYGELYTSYSEVINKVISFTNQSKEKSLLSKKGDILVPSSGETPIDIATVSSIQLNDVLLGGDLNVIRLKNNNGIFFAYYLRNYKKINIARLSQGHSVVHLYNSHLKTLRIKLPSLKEQQKIALFLTNVDNWIENLKKQKENLDKYKKGLMQKIFSQEIRFKEKNGKDFPNWEVKKLHNMLSMVIDNRGKTPPIASSGISLIEVNALGGKEINYSKVAKFVIEETYKNWFRKHLQKNDVLFSTVGATALCAMYTHDRVAVVAQNIVGLRFENENPHFMYYLLTESKNNHKFKRIQMGAVQPSVKVSQMVKISFEVPSLHEENKIADFLTSVDKVIESKQQQITLAENWKKGLMQKMFI